MVNSVIICVVHTDGVERTGVPEVRIDDELTVGDIGEVVSHTVQVGVILTITDFRNDTSHSVIIAGGDVLVLLIGHFLDGGSTCWNL